MNDDQQSTRYILETRRDRIRARIIAVIIGLAVVLCTFGIWGYWYLATKVFIQP
jgi:hypothetical protein